MAGKIFQSQNVLTLKHPLMILEVFQSQNKWFQPPILIPFQAQNIPVKLE